MRESSSPVDAVAQQSKLSGAGDDAGGAMSPVKTQAAGDVPAAPGFGGGGVGATVAASNGFAVWQPLQEGSMTGFAAASSMPSPFASAALDAKAALLGISSLQTGRWTGVLCRYFVDLNCCEQQLRRSAFALAAHRHEPVQRHGVDQNLHDLLSLCDLLPFRGAAPAESVSSQALAELQRVFGSVAPPATNQPAAMQVSSPGPTAPLAIPPPSAPPRSNSTAAASHGSAGAGDAGSCFPADSPFSPGAAASPGACARHAFSFQHSDAELLPHSTSRTGYSMLVICPI